MDNKQKSTKKTAAPIEGSPADIVAPKPLSPVLVVLALSGLCNGITWAIISSSNTQDGMGALAQGYAVLFFYSPFGCAWGILSTWASGKLARHTGTGLWNIVGVLNLLQCLFFSFIAFIAAVMFFGMMQ